jgi:long-subunit fatty acid transport protein
MKKRVGWFLVLLVLCSFVTVTGVAQYPEDALRLALPGAGVGTRALGMGNAYIGVASDYSAIYWNPAGLAQARFGEFSAGLSHSSMGDNSSFFGNRTLYESSATNLNHIGLVYPVPVKRGSFAIAFGYNRRNDFTGGLEFGGFNPSDSYIQSWAPDSSSYNSGDLATNLAYQLYLANIDSIRGIWDSKIKNRTTQRAEVSEGGGLNDWSMAAAIDVAKNFSLGATLTYISGSYTYSRDYTEEDLNNLYTVLPFDFARLTVKDRIDGSSYGWGGSFGLLYRVPDKYRFGLTVKFPTSYRISETYSTSATSLFDNKDTYDYETGAGKVEYEVLTPWKFGFGGSATFGDLLVAADAEFCDYTTLEFSTGPQGVLDYNLKMRDIFREAWNYRLGAEYEFPNAGFRLRGGYMFQDSPYKGDDDSFAHQYLTLGGGVLLSGSVMLDAAYAHGWWKTFTVNDGGVSRADEEITTNTIFVTLAFRF